LRDCVVWPGTVIEEATELSSAILTPWGSYRIKGKEAHPVK
jgi:hypothetical protein